MIDIELLSATQAQPLLAALCDVLQGCVADGASVGFIDADDRAAIERFWQDKIYSLASGDNQLLVAWQAGEIVATVMLGFSSMPNGRHRAEISKLLVHPRARRQGIARRLMLRAEQLAQLDGLCAIFLAGYQEVGQIVPTRLALWDALTSAKDIVDCWRKIKFEHLERRMRFLHHKLGEGVAPSAAQGPAPLPS